MTFMKSMIQTYFALIFFSFHSWDMQLCPVLSFFSIPHLMLPGWVSHCSLQGMHRMSFTFRGELNNIYEIISHLCEV